jgi:CHAT domain-containing protein
VSGEDKHLSIEQIECLVEVQPSETRDPEFLEQARQHLQDCEACQRLVSMEREGDRILRGLMNDAPVEGSRLCPQESLLFELAGGMLNEKEAEKLMKHAAECDHCGPFLRRALEAFSSERQSSEEMFIGSLESSRDTWQRNLAARLATLPSKDTKAPDWGPFWSQWRTRASVFSRKPIFSFATILLIFVAGFLFIRREQLAPQQRVGQLLAQSYTEHRTLEPRIAGAKYAPLRVERGSTGSNLDRPPSLLKAESLIAENIRHYPNDPAWLEAKGRADLLDGNYDSAIMSLRRGLEIQPDSSQLLTDLASAYFERAETANRPIDYGNAVELLGKVLSKSPDDPVALFNRAIASERSLLYVQAVDDWEHYLRIDARGDWADEARKRLTELKEKLRKHDQSGSEPLLSPFQISTALELNGALPSRLSDRFDDYLNLATRDWLVKAYPPGKGEGDNVAEARTALRLLADLMVKNHGDAWLLDLLSSVSSPSFTPALVQLSEAIKANSAGDNVSAREHASAAELLFYSASNDAGALRARVEYMFASQDAQDGHECRRFAKSLDTQMETHTYPWLKAQYLIEQGNCAWLMGNLGEARSAFELASKQAEASGYDAIYLRTQDHLSLLDGTIGDLTGAWERNQRALVLYWSAPHQAMRGYNLYYDRYEFARTTKQPHLQMAAWRSGLALSESFTDNVLRAMAHSLMANAAVAADDPHTAEEQFERASQLFVASPQIRSTRIDHIEAETRLAEVEAGNGKLEQALSRLHGVENEVSEISDNYLAILFYTTIGGAESRRGNFQMAEPALRSAISLAELHLQSIRDDDSRLMWSQRTSGSYRDLVELQLRRGDTVGSLELWEWYRGSSLRGGIVRNRDSVTKNSSWEEPHGVAEQLSSLTHETMIAYALLPQGLATWVFDDRGIFGVWTEGKPISIEEKINHFRRLCADPNSNERDIRENARALYDLLVAPIGTHLSAGRTLVVELDETLSALPFDALMDSENHYVVDRNPIVFSLGAYYRSSLRTSAPIGSAMPVLVAAVSTSKATGYPSVTPLPDAVSEAEMVARRFHSAKLLSGDQATVESMLFQLNRAAVFHFAGHATASVQRSGLLLWDGLLGAESLKTVHLPKTNLVVLSACDTEDGSGEGVYDTQSLVRIFMHAGVPHIVASRWNVDSTSTREFMDLFYAALLAGGSVSESTRQAEMAVRSRHGFAHPYYWSAFSSFGLV